MNEEMQRVSIAAAMMLKTFTVDGIFAFNPVDIPAVLGPSGNVGIGTVMYGDTKLVVVWTGQKSKDDIEEWLSRVEEQEITVEVPFANTDAHIN